MSQARTKKVAFVVQKNLGLVHQAPKRRAMHNAVPVALVLAATGRWRLYKAAATRRDRITGVGSKHQLLREPVPQVRPARRPGQLRQSGRT